MKRILLVDDSNTSLMMTRMAVMKLRDVRLYTANDGKEAIEKALRHRPDVILMDVEMPVMDGFESTRNLRDNPQTRDIPVIMLTTRTEIESINRGFDCGCVDYLPKPVQVLPLIEAVRLALKRNSSSSQRRLRTQATPA